MPRTVTELLAAARARLRRVGPVEAAAARAAGALIVDIRCTEIRRRDGELPGAHVIDRNVLEWRLDPASPYRLPEVTGHDQTIIVVCAEGYASSLAAVALQEIGLRNATDLEGGFAAWVAAGLPHEPGRVRNWIALPAPPTAIGAPSTPWDP